MTITPGMSAYHAGNRVLVQAIDEDWALIVYVHRPLLAGRNVVERGETIRRGPVRPWRWVPLELVYP